MQGNVSATINKTEAIFEIRQGDSVVYLGDDANFGMVGTVSKLLPGRGIDGSDAARVAFPRVDKIIRLSMLAPVTCPEGGAA